MFTAWVQDSSCMFPSEPPFLQSNAIWLDSAYLLYSVSTVWTADDSSHPGIQLLCNCILSFLQRRELPERWWSGGSHPRHCILCCLPFHHSPGTMGMPTSSLCQLLPPTGYPWELRSFRSCRSILKRSSCLCHPWDMASLVLCHSRTADNTSLQGLCFSSSPAPALWGVVTNLWIPI